jgi:acetyl-CoA carboxylase carboxyl transferase subunit beta
MAGERGDQDNGGAWFHRERGGQVPQSAERGDADAISGLWRKCDGCAEYVRTEELIKSAMVCVHCAHHHKIGGEERLKFLVDEGSFEELDSEFTSEDPLEFVDTKSYRVRLDAAIEKTGKNSAFLYGPATLAGRPIAIGTFLFAFMGGSMGSVVGEKVTRLFELALAERRPAICINSSGGARMQEGVLSLMQMARSTAVLGRLRDAGIPYISLLTHPTFGGVAASFAMLGDVILAEPKALIGFAGPRVIEQTIREVLPEGFQRSEFLLDHGMIDQVVDRRDLGGRIADILSLLVP